MTQKEWFSESASWLFIETEGNNLTIGGTVFIEIINVWQIANYYAIDCIYKVDSISVNELLTTPCLPYGQNLR